MLKLLKLISRCNMNIFPKEATLNKQYSRCVKVPNNLRKYQIWTLLYSNLNGKWSLTHKLADDLNLNSIDKIIIQHKYQVVV